MVFAAPYLVFIFWGRAEMGDLVSGALTSIEKTSSGNQPMLWKLNAVSKPCVYLAFFKGAKRG